MDTLNSSPLPDTSDMHEIPGVFDMCCMHVPSGLLGFPGVVPGKQHMLHYGCSDFSDLPLSTLSTSQPDSWANQSYQTCPTLPASSASATSSASLASAASLASQTCSTLDLLALPALPANMANLAKLTNLTDQPVDIDLSIWAYNRRSRRNMRRCLDDIASDLEVSAEMLLCYAGHEKYSCDTPQRRAGCIYGRLAIYHDVVLHLVYWMKGLLRRSDVRQYMARATKLDEALHLLDEMGSVDQSNQSNLCNQPNLCNLRNQSKPTDHDMDSVDGMLGCFPRMLVKQCIASLAWTRRNDQPVQPVQPDQPVQPVMPKPHAPNTKRKISHVNNGVNGVNVNSVNVSPAKKQPFWTTSQLDQLNQMNQMNQTNQPTKTDTLVRAVWTVGQHGRRFRTADVADWLQRNKCCYFWTSRPSMITDIRRQLVRNTVVCKDRQGRHAIQGLQKYFMLKSLQH